MENAQNMDVEGGEIQEREITSILNEEIWNFRAQDYSADDDKEPAPKNIPTAPNTAKDGMCRAWGSEPIGARYIYFYVL